MDGTLARTGMDIALDLADVLAVACGHQRTADKCEREGGKIIERGGKHRLTPYGEGRRNKTVPTKPQD